MFKKPFYHQKKIIESGLDMDDRQAQIFAALAWFANRQSTETTLYENEVYFLTSYDKLVKCFPLMRIGTKQMKKYVDSLVTLELIKRHPMNRILCKTFIARGAKWDLIDDDISLEAGENEPETLPQKGLGQEETLPQKGLGLATEVASTLPQKGLGTGKTPIKSTSRKSKDNLLFVESSDEAPEPPDPVEFFAQKIHPLRTKKFAQIIRRFLDLGVTFKQLEQMLVKISEDELYAEIDTIQKTTNWKRIKKPGAFLFNHFREKYPPTLF